MYLYYTHCAVAKGNAFAPLTRRAAEPRMDGPRSGAGVNRSRVLPYGIVFLSGACALVYEIVWTRVFTPVFGLSIHATTAVLCAFMAGLGLGSAAAPSILRRWRGSRWTLYVLLEIVIGIGALLVPFAAAPITAIYLAATGDGDPTFLTSLLRFGLAMLAMALPTVAMGLTLPVLVHAFRSIAAEDRVSSRRVGLLYGANTLGAAVGCVLVGFVLLYHYGVLATTYATAATNLLLAGLVAAFLARGGPVSAVADPAPVPAAGTAPTSPDGAPRPGTILILYGLIGFTALAFELCWFRILVFYLQSATYSFSVMLTLYLLGLGAGSLVYSRFLEQRLQSASPARVLGAVQVLIALIGAATLHVYQWIPALWTWMIGGLGADTWWIILLQKVVVAALVILPTTFLYGISFPLVARLYKRGRAEDSRTVAFLYGANTLGAIAGTLVAGFVLFDTLGVQRSLAVLSGLSAVIGAAFLGRALRSGGRPRVLFTLGIGLLVVTLVAIPDRALIADFERHTGKVLFYKETAADICFVHERAGHRVLAFGDGRGAAGSAPLGNYANRLLAYSAMALKPDAKDVLVISMGAGNTASAFAQFPIDRLDIVDISEGPFEAAAYFPTNLAVLDDPRVHTVVEDGRNYLLRTSRQYDIIQLELPTLHTAGVVYLYTTEFYEIARDRLKDGGLLSQWIDINQTGRPISLSLIGTMLDVFPNSSVWSDNWSWWIAGSKQDAPQALDYEAIRSTFADPNVRRDLRSVQSGLEDTLSKLVAAGPLLEETVRDARRITDDHTVADFLVPKTDAPSAYGGGVGYYTSPMAEVFHERWKKDRSRPVQFRRPEFHDPPARKRKRAEALESIAGDLPPASLERTREIRDASR
ncbi:MAG: spermidine synthase [Gemmatimonadota bacterium]|nr:MAG: spermidine synthase [Gemmatimonadota bacterium]